MELTLGQTLAVGLAAVLYGFTKTGILGMGAIITPLLLCFFTPPQALGIALPIIVFADILALVLLRKTVEWRVVLAALPWAFAGIFMSWRLLLHIKSMPAETGNQFLSRLIAGIMLFLVVAGLGVRIARSRRARDAAAPVAGMTPGRRVLAVTLSLFGGIVTMIANNSGPAWVVYLMLFRLDKYRFMGTGAWIIFALSLAKLPPTIQLGYVTMDTLKLNLYLAPLVVLGVAIGGWAVKRISQKFFDNLVQAFALGGALYLLLR